MSHGRSALFLLVAWLGSCGSHALPEPRQSPSAAVELIGADADVWAFTLEISGRAPPGSEPGACHVRAGEQRFGVQALDARVFRAQLTLEPGDNAVQAECAGARSQVLHYRVRLTAAPRAAASVRPGSAPDRLVLDASGSRPSESKPAPLAEFTWYAFGEDRALGRGERLEIARPAGLEQLYVLRVRDAAERGDEAEVLWRATPAPVDGVVYGVIPPLYGSPPLQALTQALAGLADLGVDYLWLSPIFTPAEGDYGYAVRDYLALRPDFGSEADLQQLITRAHALGLRVLLDLPANHTSDTHPYYLQAAALGQASHYFSFYARDSKLDPTHYFDWVNLPNLDYHNAEVARWMIEVSDRWVKKYAIDGYRLDAAWGIRERDPEFWPRFAAELRRLRPEAWLIAEAPANDPYYDRSTFTAAYDWTHDLGKHSWEHVFDQATGIASRLYAAVAKSDGPRVLTFLNNNDTGARFITRHGEPLTRVATAALLTLPGLPCLYAFDEEGADFEPYGALHAITQRNPALHAFHKRWLQLRRALPALRGAGFEAVHVGERDEVLAYLRVSEADVALVALNFSAQAVAVELELPHWRAQRARDVAGGAPLALHAGRVQLTLEPWAARVFVPE